MTPLHKVIINKETKINPIWIMRQAGRYLPEFREIRKQNPDFVNLCLNENLSTEITLQPLKRFNLDAAIIFSDILMLPYGLNQKVKFEKGFGPKLGEVNLEEMSKIDEVDFVEKVYPVYKAIKKVSTNEIVKNKNTIGFVGAPWTLLVYIINQQSPKKNLKRDFFKNDFLINRVLLILEKFLKIHIKNQIDNGANVICAVRKINPEFKEYIKQVRNNAKKLSKILIDLGYNISTNGTDNHIVLCNVKDKGITGSKIEKITEYVDISINKNAVYGDTSPMSPGGIRLGTSALTTRGFKEDDFIKVAHFIKV